MSHPSPGPRARARRATSRRTWLVATVAAAVLGAAPAAGAQAPTTTVPPPTSTSSSVPARVVGGSPDGRELPEIVDPRLDPDLSRVAVDNPDFDAALARYRQTERNLATAVETERSATELLAQLRDAEARLQGTLNESTRRLDKSEARLDDLQASLRSLAVEDYMRGGSVMASDLNLDVDDATSLRAQRVVVRSVRSTKLEDARRHTQVVDDMTATIADTVAQLDEVRGRIVDTTATRDGAVADQVRLRGQLERDVQAIADTRLEGDVVGLDFTLVALDAYYKAAKRLVVEDPSCRIEWSFLAGISRTEGHHGTFGGAELLADGTVSKPILGIALDGSNGTAAIGDTDGGEYDGDPSTDRAVGPMQFIPSTWVRWAEDGNGDGRIDPQNMYDAALAAARYLCHSGPGLDTDEGISRASYSYNQSDEYVAVVLSRTKAYAEHSLPSATSTGSAPR